MIQDKINNIVSVQQLEHTYRQLATDTQAKVVDWFDVQLDAIYKSGKEPLLFSWEMLFTKKTLFFWFAPSIKALITCLLNRQVIYMCWGLPDSSRYGFIYFLKVLKLKIILNASSLILVNDKLTLGDLKKFGLNHEKVKIFPYIVDNNFFSFAPYHERNDFLLVPGDNDRDENLIREISLKSSRKIIRVTRNKETLEFYRQNPSPHIVLKFDISFANLRDLYQQACIVMLPIKSSNHAAGQTSVLEAISCGAPILISQGRTSSIVSHYNSVLEVSNNRLDTWIKSIEKLEKSVQGNPNILQKTASSVAHIHSPEVVSRQFSELIQAV